MSDVSVTTVPAGDVIVTSRSSLFVCPRKVVTSASSRYVSRPLTTIVEVVSPLSVSAVTAAFWNVCGVPVQATGMLVVVVLEVDVLDVDEDVELLLDDEVELDVDELVLVDDVVDDEVLDVVDEDVLDDDVLVVVVEDVLVVVEPVVDVELDVEDDVDELEVLVLELVELLVLELVELVVVVAKSHPMSVMRSRASDGSVMSVVYDGSMSSFGVHAVSQCDTDEPFASVVGAYICT